MLKEFWGVLRTGLINPTCTLDIRCDFSDMPIRISSGRMMFLYPLSQKASVAVYVTIYYLIRPQIKWFEEHKMVLL
jgi:hypothetical protein